MLKIINKNQKLFTIMLSLLTLSSIIFTMNTSVFAAVLPDIATTTTHVTNIVNHTYGGESCSNVGGLSVTSSGSNKRMYSLKASNEQNEAVLYFFKNYDNITDSNYGRIRLSNLVGHANGMTIDDNYIYITGWNSTGNNPDAKNDIIRISRNTIWTMYNAKEEIDKGKLTASSDGVTVFSAVDSNNNVWDKRIYGITKYQSNGNFIINHGLATTQNGTQVLKFTTATITNNKFVVSTSAADVFSVDTGLSNTTGQDFEYSPACGLMIPRWHDGSDSTKMNNTIVWIKLNSLSGDNRTYTEANSNFRHIIVNANPSQFSKYEIESISFDNDNELYASVNLYPYTYSRECIIKIQRATATNSGTKLFLGTSINQ